MTEDSPGYVAENQSTFDWMLTVSEADSTLTISTGSDGDQDTVYVGIHTGEGKDPTFAYFKIEDILRMFASVAVNTGQSTDVSLAVEHVLKTARSLTIEAHLRAQKLEHMLDHQRRLDQEREDRA